MTSVGLQLRSCLYAVAGIAVAFALRLWADPFLNHDYPTLLFVPVVAAAAWFGGWAPTILALVFSVASADWFLIAPRHSWRIDDPAHFIGLVGFIAIGLLFGLFGQAARSARLRAEESRAEAVRRQAEVAQQEVSRQAVAEALRRSEARYRRVIENLQEGVWITDSNGTIAYANRRWADMLGVPVESLPGRAVNEFRFPEDRALPSPASHCALEGTHELRWRKHDGGELWTRVSCNPLLDDHDRPATTMCLLTDITEIRRAAFERREFAAQQERQSQLLAGLTRAAELNKAQLHAVIDSIEDGVIIGDATGKLVLMNAAAITMHGFSSIHEVPPTFSQFAVDWEFADLDGRPLLLEDWPITRALGGQEVARGEWRIRHRVSGRCWICAFDSRIVRGPDGSPALFVFTVRDITATTNAQQQLREARQLAEAANSSKDRFLAALSHELRTPLAPVLLIASALEEHPGLSPEIHEDLVMIRRNVELECSLIDDLLDLTRIRHGKLALKTRVVDVHKKIENVLAICWDDMDAKKITLSLDLKAARCCVHGDAARIQQILWNLLKNAVKFTSEGGRVDIHTVNDPGGRLLIHVRDSGIGIEPELLPRIFNAFDQGGLETTQRFGGLGLGLTISRKLAEVHHGTLTAHSPGKGFGATFTLCLPTTSAPLLPVSPAVPHNHAVLLGPPLRVLLVEDHPDTARVMRKLLNLLNCQVQTAGSIAEALALGEQHAFDLLISDIGLPDGQGYDLMRLVKKRWDLRGIALSGYGMEDDIRKSRDAGFDDHLIKPVNFSALETVVTRQRHVR